MKSKRHASFNLKDACCRDAELLLVSWASVKNEDGKVEEAPLHHDVTDFFWLCEILDIVHQLQAPFAKCFLQAKLSIHVRHTV